MTASGSYWGPQWALVLCGVIIGLAFTVGFKTAVGDLPALAFDRSLGPAAARLKTQWGDEGLRYLEITGSPGLLALELAPDHAGKLIGAANPRPLVNSIVGFPQFKGNDPALEAEDAAALIWHGPVPLEIRDKIFPTYRTFGLPGLQALARWGTMAATVLERYANIPQLPGILMRFGPELVIPVVYDYYNHGSWVVDGERGVASALRQGVSMYHRLRAELINGPPDPPPQPERPLDPEESRAQAGARAIAWIDADGLDFLNEFQVDAKTGQVSRKPATTAMTQLAFPATRGIIDHLSTGRGWTWGEAAWSAVEILPWTGFLARAKQAGLRSAEVAAWTVASTPAESVMYHEALTLLESEYGPTVARRLLGLGAEAPLVAGYARVAGPGFLRAASTIGKNSLRAVEMEGPGAARQLGGLSAATAEELAGADVDTVRLALRDGTEEAANVASRYPKAAPALLELSAGERAVWTTRILRYGWPVARLAVVYAVITHPFMALRSLYQLGSLLHIPPWISVGAGVALFCILGGQFLWFPIWLGLRILTLARSRSPR